MSELSCFDDQLSVMFPGDRFAEWDHQRVYAHGRLAAYLEVYAAAARVPLPHEKPDADERPTKMLSIDLQAPLRDLVTGQELCRYVVVHVFVARSEADREFRERFLRR